MIVHITEETNSCMEHTEHERLVWMLLVELLLALDQRKDMINYAAKPPSTNLQSYLSHYTALGDAGCSAMEDVNCGQDYY